jgi:sortase A
MTSIREVEGFALRIRRFVRWTHYVFTITGILAISYVALVLLGARVYQHHAALTLAKQVQAEENPAGPRQASVPGEGDLLGRIEIPRIGLSVAVLQGTTKRTLLMGVGHMAGTALPGQSGNIGIAGHRDTFFRDLKDIRSSDRILLRTASGVIAYEVEWIQITSPGDGSILSPTTASSLTLVTCYPFHFIGAAPERYVVHARRQ